MLKKTFLYSLVFILSLLQAAESYQQQIRVWDDCTYAMETHRNALMHIRSKRFQEINATNAVAVCEQSLRAYPNDPHVKFLLARAYLKDHRDKQAFRLASEACLKGDIGGCTLLGGMHAFGKAEHSSFKKSFLLYLWGCTRGDSQACLNLYGQAEGQSAYVPHEIKETDAKMMSLCLRGDYPLACHQYAKDLLRDGRDGKYAEEYEFAISRSCLSGNQEGCFLYGELLKEKHIRNRKNKQLYVDAKACNNGNGKACLYVAHYYGAKKRTKINNIAALALYEDTCKKGLSATACRYAGSYYLSDLEGIEQNVPLGLSYLEDSCKPRKFHEEAPGHSSSWVDIDLYGCRDLVNHYLKAAPNAGGSISKAKKVLERTCSQKNSYYYLDKTGCTLQIEACCKNLEH